MSGDIHSESNKIETGSDLIAVSVAKLKAWQVLVSEKKVPAALDDYLIYFEETPTEVRVYFKKKDQSRILGGGMGSYIVKKDTNEVIGSGLAK